MTGLKILLADDDDVGRYVIATMLRRAGFTVTEVSDGAEALRIVTETPPDLVVLDVKMPVMDGFETCRRIKSQETTRHVPVLMLSATFLESEAHVEGLETGADAYLTQPVEAPVLAATVRALIRARVAETEVRLAAVEWSSTFDAISDAVAVLTSDGTVLRANQAFRSLFVGAGDAEISADLARFSDGRELVIGTRLFQVRADHISSDQANPARGRMVVTLSDITQSRAAEQQRAAALATERTISRTLQQSLLPERLPQLPHLELDAWHVAAAKDLIVGGDWYDVIEGTDGNLWLVIGDVAGHGVVAAAQAGQLRHSLRVYAHEGYGLAESMERLNELVCSTALTGMATLCIVAIDPRATQAELILAGHLPPLIIPREGQSHFTTGGLGPVLGYLGATYRQAPIPFDQGDRIVLYTDGLIERRGETLDEGFQRMRNVAEGVSGLASLRAELIDKLVDASTVGDDVALLLAERTA